MTVQIVAALPAQNAPAKGGFFAYAWDMAYAQEAEQTGVGFFAAAWRENA